MIIGFCGRKRSGKTTLAKFLEKEENAVVITVASFLKHLCCTLLDFSYDELSQRKDSAYTFDVVPDERWFKIISKRTDIDIEIIRKELSDKHIKTVRQLLQLLGTDIIRKYNKNWHVNQMIEEIKSYSEDRLIVVDDVRFKNERKAIEDMGGQAFFIVRPTNIEVSNHISELSLRWQDFDNGHVIINDGDIDKLTVSFLVHYRNNFDCFIDNSILLSENKSYLENCYFGYETPHDDELLNSVLGIIKDDSLFTDYGVIRYKTYDRILAEQYIDKVDKAYKKNDDVFTCHRFVTYNPLITENLKLYL